MQDAIALTTGMMAMTILSIIWGAWQIHRRALSEDRASAAVSKLREVISERNAYADRCHQLLRENQRLGASIGRLRESLRRTSLN